MQLLFFLPPLAYGFALATAGDFLLLVISMTSVVVWILPRLIESRTAELKPISESSPWPTPPLGQLVTKEGAEYQLPPSPKSQLIAMNLNGLDSEKFLCSFLQACQEEFWLVGSHSQAGFMQQISPDADSQLLVTFAKQFKSRADIPLALNLLVTDLQAALAKEELAELFKDVEENYRILFLGRSRSEAALDVEQRNGVYRVTGIISGSHLEFYFADSALTGEQTNYRSYEGLPSSQALGNVGKASSQHRTASGNKPKWFNLPAGRVVINKRERGEVGGLSKDQVGHGSSSEVRGADPVSDISTRLANLGHRIELD